MDSKTEKRIDSLYRNMKSFPLLIVLSIFVPVIMLFVVPLSLAYLYLRAKLMRDIETGRVVVDSAQTQAPTPPKAPSTAEKIGFIQLHTGRLWTPIIILIGVTLLISAVILAG